MLVFAHSTNQFALTVNVVSVEVFVEVDDSEDSCNADTALCQPFPMVNRTLLTVNQQKI
jgi:hypothetical protein